MKTILSTKKLSPSQKGLITNAGISLVEYNAIKIEFIPFEIPSTIENAIFTSQNAVFSIQNSEFRIQNCKFSYYRT
jgi:uroporphyrinogen-III synthase